MLHFKMRLLALLCTLCAFVKAGRIINGDLWVDYANAGSMTELSFSFMLENPIDEFDYIKASLPFPLHSSLIPAYPAIEGLSLPFGLQVTYQQVDSSSNIQPTVRTCQALTQTIDSSKYFIRFYDDDRKTLLPIPNNKWYHLKFKIKQIAPLEYQKSNSILQVQLSTVSSVASNAMVYDDNLAFNYFELASAPTEGITLKTTPYEYGAAGGYLLTQQNYSLYMDVSMDISTYQFEENLQLVFFIGQNSAARNNFLFNGTCESVQKTNSPKIAKLNSSLYTCQVDTLNNLMIVMLTPEALATQVQYRFTVQIINPAIVLKEVDITVKAIKEVSGVILSYGIDEAALSTNQIYITYQEIFIGWGLRPDALLPFDARVYRADSATPTYMPYNSLSTKFSISQTTSTDIQLKIQINIPSESSAHVLENGYTHNLPAFPGKEVRCVVEYADDTIKRKIACTGVGSLTVGQVYEIGWKMYFPYDNYQSSIDCTQFGLITIYTGQSITKDDNVFILGRDNQFLEFLKDSDEYYVIGRNTSYITYMKTFANLNLVVLSSDFQDFLKIPEEIIVTNRPATYADKRYKDVYVVGQNLAFMTYLELFSDLYVAYKLKGDSDILKGYDTTPIVATSMPKNTLTIKTSNSKNWADLSLNQNPLISSTQTAGYTATSSLQVIPSTDQTLVFSLAAPFSEVSSLSSTDTPITDNWGMLIMFNHKIKVNDPTVVLYENPSNTLSVEGVTVDDSAAYNKYSMITLKASTTGQIQTSFPTGRTKTSFGVEHFLIEDFSSFYSDEDNFDIMIATIDGIDGPLNRIVYNGFFLINGFSLTGAGDIITPAVQTSFVAYNQAAHLDGSEVPTLFRVKGAVPSSTNFNTLNLFFDKITPFFENYHNGDIYCESTDGTPYCKFYKGTEAVLSYQEYNYMTYSRIQIKLNQPGTNFDILIPVITTDANSDPLFHLGYSEIDSTTGRIMNRYIQPRKVFTQTGGYSATGTYGPDLTGKQLGETVSNMVLKANYAGVSQNTGSDWGAAFLYFSDWDYFKTQTTTWANGPCYMMSYLLYQTNYELFISQSDPFTYTYKNMKGVVCFCDTGVDTSTASLNFATGYLPAKYGLAIPGKGAYSQKTGQLLVMKGNYMNFAGSLVLNDAVTTPTMGPNLAKSVGQWVIPLPVALTDNVQIIMTGTGGVNLPFTSDSLGTCCVNINGIKTPIGCIYTSSLTEMDYVLTIKERDLLPAGTDLEIMHYDLTTNASYSTQLFDLKVYSLVNTNSPGNNDIIFYKDGISFNYNADDPTYLGPSQLILSSYHQQTNNKAAVTAFNLSFTLISKGIYLTNRVRINLGQYEVDNSASQISPRCKIYEYSPNGSPEYSHDWASIDISRGFDDLEFWPERNLLSTNLTYTVKCYNFLAASTSSPQSISAMVVNTSADLTGQLSTTTSISLATLVTLPKSNQVSATKKFTIPSTLMEISFTVTSPGITPDSILYIGFPSYYANGLGSDIKCYSSTQIYCRVQNGRQLMVRYIGTFSEGTQFIVQVAGVSQPVNYNSGTFYFVIDNDDNRNTVLSSGTFIDSVSTSVLSTQNFPAFQILSFSQSSAYLREEGITLFMEFYIPSTLTTVTVGQYLFLVFPPNFGNVLRFVEPVCTLNIRGNSLKNYVSSCEVKGMRIKMPFLDDLVLGSVYSLTVEGIINPINPSSNVYKYALQISGSTGSTIIARSFSPHANFEMPIFVLNPIRKSLNYYTEQDGLVTQVTTTVNIQSKEIFISPDELLTTSAYSRNVYLQPYSNLYSEPSKISLLSGQNPFPIRMSGLTSGVNYIFFEKTGDGGFYSSLPPLTLLINKNYFTPVSFIETSFNLPVAPVNTNYTVAVNLPFELYPITQVSIGVTLSSSSVGISLRQSPTTIKFYPDKTSASIRLYINDATLWTAGTTCDFVFTPQDTTTYASSATIPITASSAVNSKPSLSFSVQKTTLKTATFSVTCSEHGRFVYHVSRLFNYNKTACTLTKQSISYWIQQSSIDGLRVDQTFYDCEDRMGMANIVTPGSAQDIVIQNIKASSSYTINGYCISQIGSTSDLIGKQFATISNGGYVSKMDFYFSEILSSAQKIKLVCALALKFEINYEKVSTADGYYCSELLDSRLLLEVAPSRRLLSALTYPYRVQVYFGVNTDLNEDLSPATINAQSITQTSITDSLLTVVGLPSLIEMSVSEASYVGVNSLQEGFYLDIGPNYLYIQGLSMPKNGIIYVIVGQNSLWPRDPVISQIKKGSGPNGLPPVFFKVLPYRTEQVQSGYVAYAGMPKEDLTLYLLASDDNPFDTASFGSIEKFEIVAEVPTWENKFVVVGSLLMLFVLVL